MLSGTHQRIGLTILQSLKPRFAVNVAVDDYKFGCIKPDFSRDVFYTPHLKDKSFDFVIGMIAELGSLPPPSDGKALKSFSTRLGVIMHFLADFFCYVHNQKKDDPLPLHFAYEAGLHIVSHKVSLDDLAQECLALLHAAHTSSVEALSEFLEDLHQRYLAATPSMKTDLRFAIAAGVSAAHFVLSACQSKALEQAA